MLVVVPAAVRALAAVDAKRVPGITGDKDSNIVHILGWSSIDVGQAGGAVAVSVLGGVGDATGREDVHGGGRGDAAEMEEIEFPVSAPLPSTPALWSTASRRCLERS